MKKIILVILVFIALVIPLLGCQQNSRNQYNQTPTSTAPVNQDLQGQGLQGGGGGLGGNGIRP